jgi:hypothetical protein
MRWMPLAISCMICTGTAAAGNGGSVTDYPADSSALSSSWSLLHTSPTLNTSAYSYNDDLVTVTTGPMGVRPSSPFAISSSRLSTVTPSGYGTSAVLGANSSYVAMDAVIDGALGAQARRLSIFRTNIPKPKHTDSDQVIFPIIRLGALLLVLFLGAKGLMLFFQSPWEDLVDGYFD